MPVTRKINKNRVSKKTAVKWSLGTAASIATTAAITSDSRKGAKLSRGQTVAARTGVAVGVPLVYQGVKKYRARKGKMGQRSGSGPRKRKH